MTIKSVVDIDLNEEKFKRFTDLYGKYEAALKKQPGEWQAAEKGADATGDAVNKIMAAFLATGQFHREMNEENEKDNKNLKQKAGLWQNISKSSSRVLKDVEGIAKWMLKLGAIALGTGIAGFFGIRSIASDVSNQRNQALGLDLNVGDRDAFARDQGRNFSNPDALLQGASTARSNLSSPAYAAIASLGINPNQGTVAIANQLLTKLQAMAKALPQQQLGNLLQEYPGLSQFGVDLEGLKRLRNISSSELQGQIAAFGPDAKNAGLNDRQAKAFQDFNSSIDRTFAMVTKQVERDLVLLLGPIQKLIRSLGKDVSLFLRSKAAADGIDAFAKSIDRFATYLSSSGFKQDVDSLESGATSIFNVLGFIGHVLAHPLDTLGDTWGDFTKWAKDKETAAHGGDPNWKEKLQAQSSGGFIANMREHVNQHPGLASASLPLMAMTQMSMPRPLAPVKVQARLEVKVHNATGSNLNLSVNQLHGGVN